MLFEKQLKKDLAKRAADNNLRKLNTDQGLIDFSSNDYLGLSKNYELYQSIADKHKHHPINGSSGSRLLAGNSQYYEEVEHKLAQLFKAESTLIFNSGYVANLAILSTIPKKGDTIIYDELAHACIKTGVRLTLAKRFSFKHNSLKDLKQKLSKATGQKFVVVESVYSMDGDECPIHEIVGLAGQYDAQIIIDEAHTTGVYGRHGSGLVCDHDLHDKIFARIYTFGKAMGIHGAAIAGSSLLTDYLINFSRPFIFTTALPPHNLVAIEMAFEFLKNNIPLQQLSKEKVDFFNQAYDKSLKGKYNKIESQHPIQSLIVPGNDEVKSVSASLLKAGFDVRPILSPTVKKGEERIRICLHTYNSNDDISRLIDTLAALK